MKLIHAITAIALGLSLSSCTKDEVQATISFNHEVDGETLMLHDVSYLNEAGNSYDVRKLMYIVSNIQLENENGDSYQLSDMNFIDVDKGEGLQTTAAQSIPQGKYNKIRFTFGLDEIDNVSNAFLEEDYHESMLWPEMMGGGYHYMKLEGEFTDVNGDPQFYNTHTGRLMENDHHIDISLPIDLDVTANFQLVLTMNINNWYTGPNTYDFNSVGSGIMGNEDAQTSLMENGTNVFSVSLQ